MAMVFTNDTYAPSEAGFGNKLVGGRGQENAVNFLTSTTLTQEVRVVGTISRLEVIVGQSGVFWMGQNAAGQFIAKYGTSTTEVALDSTVSAIDGIPHHLALTIGPLGGKLFVDGILAASSATSSTAAGSNLGGGGTYMIREQFANVATFDYHGTVDEVALFYSEKYTANFTPPTAPYVGNEADLAALFHMDAGIIGLDSGAYSYTGTSATLTYSGAIGTTIAPDNASILYSPYNWLVGAAEAKSINSGAYFRTIYTSSSCALKFDLTGVSAPFPRICIKVDGRTIQNEDVASTINVIVPSDQSNTKHLLEVVFDASSELVNRWTTQATAVKLTGIVLADGGTVQAPVSRPNSLLVYGDSITEGVKTLSPSGSFDVDRNSAIACWPLTLASLTNSEVGVIGFGSQGFTKVGLGSVPAFASAYSFLWDGQARDFTNNPDVCLWLQGANDGSSNTVPNGLTAINGQLTAMPNTKFIILRPLKNTLQESNLQTIASTCNDPSRVIYKTTAGFWSTVDSSDNLHPYGYANLDSIGPQIATLTNSVINGEFLGATSTINISLTGIPDGAADTALIDVTNINNPLILPSQSLTYSGGTTSATVPINTGQKIVAIELGANPKTTGGADYGVTV